MNSPETLLQATINRLAVRFNKSVTKSLAYLSEIAKETPATFQRNWKEFKKEVYEEADRISKHETEQNGWNDYQNNSSVHSEVQEKIDLIRAKVAKLNRKLEEHN